MSKPTVKKYMGAEALMNEISSGDDATPSAKASPSAAPSQSGSKKKYMGAEALMNEVSTSNAPTTPAATATSASSEQPTPPAQTPKKERAGFFDQVGAGYEQGIKPWALTMAQGAYGGGEAAVKGKGGLGIASGAIEGAFDPNNTLYAKLRNKDFSDSSMTANAGNIIGNVLGEVSKIVATGGVGGLDTIAKLGARGTAKALAKTGGEDAAKIAAQQIPRSQVLKGALPYVTSKAAIGNAAGMGFGNLSAGAIQKTDWFQNLSPEEQYEALNVAATAGGLAGAGAMSKAASGAVQKSSHLSSLRDDAASKIGLPTYQSITEAKHLTNLEKIPGVKELLDSGQVTPAQVTQHLTDAGLDVAKLPTGSSVLGDVSKDIHNTVKEKILKPASEETFKQVETVLTPELKNKPINMEDVMNINKATLKLNKVQQRDSGTSIPTDFTDVDISPTQNEKYATPFASGVGHATISPTGETHVKLQGSINDLAANEKNATHNALNENLGAIKHLSELPSTDVSQPHLETAKASLTNSLIANINKLHESPLGDATTTNWLHSILNGEDATARNRIIDSMRDDKGSISGEKVADYFSKNTPAFTPSDSSKSATMPGHELSGYILGHLKDTELSNATLEKYSAIMAKQGQHAEKQDAVNRTSEDAIGKSGNVISDTLANTVYPVNPNDPKATYHYEKQRQQLDAHNTAVSMALTDHDGYRADPDFISSRMDLISDKNASTAKRLDAAEALAPIFGHMSAVIKAPKSAGYDKSAQSKQYQVVANEIKNQMLNLRIKQWSEENPGADITPRILADLKRQNELKANAVNIYVPSEHEGSRKILSLLTGSKAGTPTHQLVGATDQAVKHALGYGLSINEGRQPVGVSVVDKQGKEIGETPLSGQTIGDMIKLEQRLHAEMKVHPNIQKQYLPLLDKVQQLIHPAILEQHGQEGLDRYTKAKRLQRSILDFIDSDPVLQREKLGARDQDATKDVFGTHPSFGTHVEDIRQSAKELADLTGNKEHADTISTAADEALNKSNFRMLIDEEKGSAYRKAQLQRLGAAEKREKSAISAYKNDSWDKILTALHEPFMEMGGGNIGSQVKNTIGQQSLEHPQKAKAFWKGLDKYLYKAENTDVTPTARTKMIKEVRDDYFTSAHEHIQKVINEAMADGNITTAYAKLKELGEALIQNTDNSAILSDAAKDMPIMEVARNVARGEAGQDKVADYVQQAINSKDPLSSLLRQKSVLDETQRQAMQLSVKDVDRSVMTNPADLKAEHFKQPSNFQGSGGGWLNKVASLASGNWLMGTLFNHAAEKIKSGNVGSPAQQRRYLTDKFLEFTLAPENTKIKGPNGEVMTKGELMKAEFHKAHATLKDLQDKRWQYLKRQNRTALQAGGMGANNVITPARQFIAQYNNEDKEDFNRTIEAGKAKRQRYTIPGY